MQNRRLDQKGVTIVEVMISLVILLIVFLGLIQASILSINQNLRNEVRDEAARIASEYMAAAMATQVDSLAGAANPINAVVCPAPAPVLPLVIPPVIPPGVFVPPFPPFPPPTIQRMVRNTNQKVLWRRGVVILDTNYSVAQVTITVLYLFPGMLPQAQRLLVIL